jgi:hypothetical protein
MAARSQAPALNSSRASLYIFSGAQAAVGSDGVLEQPDKTVTVKPTSVSASTDNLLFNIWQPWK